MRSHRRADASTALGTHTLGTHIGSHDQGLYVALVSDASVPIFLPLSLGRPWQTGAVLAARVTALHSGSDGGGGFCQTQDGTRLYLRQTQGLHEGQRIHVEVVSEARGRKFALGRATDAPLRAPALRHALAHFGATRVLGVGDLDLLGPLRHAFPEDRFELRRPHQTLDQAAADALEMQEICRQGVTLICETTQAAHHIDVNTSDRRGRVQDVNQVAADLALATIMTRNLGGIIFIDFLAPPTRAARQALTRTLQEGLASLPHAVKVHAMNESGHIIIERQRLGAEFLAAYFDARRA